MSELHVELRQMMAMQWLSIVSGALHVFSIPQIENRSEKRDPNRFGHLDYANTYLIDFLAHILHCIQHEMIDLMDLN